MTTSSCIRWAGLALGAISGSILAAGAVSTEAWPELALDLDAPDAGELVSGNSAAIGEWTSTVADLDGNGRADLIIATPLASADGRTEAGIVYVLFDAASRSPGYQDLDALSRSQGVRILGARVGDRLGWSLDAVGDFDGDGVDDLIVGAPGAADGGSAWLVRGRPRVQWPAQAALDLEHDAIAAGPRFVSDADARAFGLTVAGLGDLNGDGFSDLAVSDPRAMREGRHWAGAVHVVFGGQDFPQSVSLAAATPVHGFSLRGERRGDYLGAAVTAVNGPAGRGLAVGAPGRHGSRGAVFIVDFAAGMAGRSLDAAQEGPAGLIRIDGPTAGGRFGTALASGFDFDGGDSDHLVVGAPRHQAGAQGGTGAVWFVSQRSREVSAHFVSGPGSPGFGAVIYPAGDLNRDGRADLLVDSHPEPAPRPSQAVMADRGMLVLFGGAAASGRHTNARSGVRLTAVPEIAGHRPSAQSDGERWRMRGAGATAALDAPLLLVAPVSGSDGVDPLARFHLLRGDPVGPLINDGLGITDQSVVSGGFLSIDFTVSDPFDPPDSLTLEVESGNPSLLPDELLQVSGTGGNRTLSIETPAGGATGSVVVTVRVFNTQGLFSEASFQLDIIPAGTPLINGGIGIGDQSIYEGQSLNIGFTVEDPTAPADNLIVEAGSLDPTIVSPDALTVGGADELRTLQVQTQVGATGTAGIVVTVVNPLGNSADAAFDLQVLQRPPPQVNNGGGLPQQSVIAGEALSMAFTVSDLIDSPAVVSAQAVSLTPALIPQSAVGVSGTGATRLLNVQTFPDQTGIASILVEATNSIGYVGSAILNLFIEEQPVPEINGGEPIDPLSVPEGEQPTVPFTVADPNDVPDDLLVRAFSSNQDVLPDEALELIGDGGERILEIDASLASPGTTLVTIEVTNSLGLVRTRSFELTIEYAATELSLDIEPIDAPSQAGRFFRVDVANAGDHPAIEPALLGTADGEYSMLGAYALAPDCMVVGNSVHCNPDTISSWQCAAGGSEASCTLMSLPPGGMAPLVLQVSSEGAGTLAVDVIAGNAPLQTLEIEVPAASESQP